MSSLHHPILVQSFAQIDQEMGPHSFSLKEYAIVRRIIHSTADFEFQHLVRFSEDAIASAITALQQGIPIVTDVSMVTMGIKTLVSKTFQNSILTAVEQVAIAEPGRTRTETGLLRCWHTHPDAIYVIGNAPTALLALCHRLPSAPVLPALVIGAPVGFIAVEDAKQALSQQVVPQIRIEGRKGGSAVAAAILNALLVLAWEEARSP